MFLSNFLNRIVGKTSLKMSGWCTHSITNDACELKPKATSVSLRCKVHHSLSSPLYLPLWLTLPLPLPLLLTGDLNKLSAWLLLEGFGWELLLCNALRNFCEQVTLYFFPHDTLQNLFPHMARSSGKGPPQYLHLVGKSDINSSLSSGYEFSDAKKK